MKSIRWRLLLGLFWAALATGLATTAVVYQMAHLEATELADLQLRQFALALPDQLTPHLEAPVEGEPEEVVFIRVWDARGKLKYASEGAPDLARQQGTGFASLPANGGGWRVYSLNGEKRSVQVSQPDQVRLRLAEHLAWRVILPLLVFLPLFGVLAYVLVGRALLPLERMAQAVAGRSPSALQPLELDPLSPELQAIIAAINHLLGQIDHAMTTQRRFVADAAHELRSPLTALKLQLQLAERAAGDAARDSAFAKLHERLDRASHLVRQMLTLARHEVHHAGARFSPVDLHQLAMRAVVDQSALAESRGIDLGITAASSAISVNGDPDGLGVLLNNLVDNALRYTQSGGQVDVCAGMHDGRPVLCVSDNGPGVPLRERERLFDRFYRPDGNAVWGCGLGMAIVKNVADLHGAKVVLADGLSGRGLGVTLIFPVKALNPMRAS
ncbi:MAG TPA: ATP-binding protein [Janthinobacterium sp.]|jgi:two-component system OmpR family sensor kinase|nr:ATP-binding protein [Janthinobacterium sp.]